MSTRQIPRVQASFFVSFASIYLPMAFDESTLLLSIMAMASHGRQVFHFFRVVCKGNYSKDWDGTTCLATPWARGRKWSLESVRLQSPKLAKSGLHFQNLVSNQSSPTTIETVDNGTFGG